MKVRKKYHTIFFVKLLFIFINIYQVPLTFIKKWSFIVLTLALFTLTEYELSALTYLLDILCIYSALKRKKYKHDEEQEKQCDTNLPLQFKALKTMGLMHGD